MIIDWVKNIKKILQEMYSMNNSVMDDVIITNIKRIFYVSMIALPVHLISIVTFTMNISQGDENEIKWRMGVIICHTLLFIIMSVLGGLSFFLMKKGKINFLMRLVQTVAIRIILIFGIVLVTIDQLVTPNITPFLIACTITAAVFLIRPIDAVITYVLSFIAFYYTIGLGQTNQAIILSNRVNGITAIGIGICLSLILWKTNVSNILQRRYIENQQLELAEKNRELEHLAFYDQMTGLYNRSRFEELLMYEISLVCRYEHESCIIILDIDHFKKINDKYGHPIGDVVIKQIASILLEHTRETDMVSRWGGEEFLLLLPHTSLIDGRLVAEKLRKVVEDKTFFVKESEVKITASFGVAGISSDKNNSLELAYKEADKALYLAKERGRNCVEAA